MSKYNETDTVRQLSKKTDISIEGKRIILNTGKNRKDDVGIKSRGKIDFLTNYCGYILWLG